MNILHLNINRGPYYILLNSRVIKLSQETIPFVLAPKDKDYSWRKRRFEHIYEQLNNAGQRKKWTTFYKPYPSCNKNKWLDLHLTLNDAKQLRDFYNE